MMRRPYHSARRQSGFTLTEVLVSLVVFTQVILASLLLFDFSSRVTKVQTRLSEMQQSLRVAQQEVVKMTRMAGRSGLPVTGPVGPVATQTFPPYGLAVAVANNVTGSSEEVFPGLSDTPMAIEGTDILTLRGNFSGLFFQATMATLDDTQALATAGTLTVDASTPFIPSQDLTALWDANTATVPEALLLVPSTPGVAHAVLELVPDAANNSADSVTLAFRIRGGGTDLADTYRGLWTNDPTASFPLPVNSPCYVAILEEYRLYVRNDGGDAPETARPVLSRARLLPGTALPYGDPNDTPDPLMLRTDIAQEVLDLQVSLGYDTSNGGSIGNSELGTILESADGTADDWLFNAVGDDETAAPFTVAAANAVPKLYFLRINTLARTAAADRTLEEPVLPRLEDHVYPTNSGLVNSPRGRKYRRRPLQTIVDLRNL
jgi:prepilin-type N-terminal cleavage/methylation domain-containing protein